ncbi:MAG: hypothetical protein IRY99_20235 [Isosphaeraceae bacterium]|nr:hypothetical protein [Isosphaeraceae bacterium]
MNHFVSTAQRRHLVVAPYWHLLPLASQLQLLGQPHDLGPEIALRLTGSSLDHSAPIGEAIPLPTEEFDSIPRFVSLTL